MAGTTLILRLDEALVPKTPVGAKRIPPEREPMVAVPAMMTVPAMMVPTRMVRGFVEETRGVMPILIVAMMPPLCDQDVCRAGLV